MIEHDGDDRQAAEEAVEDLGIANNTIVIYTTDNGPHQNSWPDAGDDAVPQREEHQLGGRLPRAGLDPRWPGRIQPGSISNGDLLGPRLVPDPAGGRRRSRYQRSGCWRAGSCNGRTFKVHLDGYNQLPYADRPVRQVGARRASSISTTTIVTWSRSATRTGRSMFCEDSARRHAEGLARAQFDCGRLPTIVQSAHGSRIERAPTSPPTPIGDWSLRHSFPGLDDLCSALVAQFLSTFKDYPPSAEAGELPRSTRSPNDDASKLTELPGWSSQ